VRIVYVTSTMPYGAKEPFLVPEVAELRRCGHRVTIVPMRPQGAVVHDDARPFLGETLGRPIVSGEIVRVALAEMLSSPPRTLRLLRLLLRSRTPRILAKNLAVLPKGLWLGRRMRALGPEHLHAHWASTSSTMAMIAAEVSGVPWSFTAHRWDITENNLLEIKCARACFTRVISERGARTLMALVAAPPRGLRVMRVGIETSTGAPMAADAGRRPIRVVVIADLVEVKGHRHLLDALRLLERRGRPVLVDLAGDGPLRPEIERRVTEAGLWGCVTMLGTVPHARLLDDLRALRWDAAVLPSAVTADAEEGLPVSLVEAMDAGVPVISTRVGAIPELLDGGAGMLVDGGDAQALADGLESLARDPRLRARLAAEGRRRVRTEFDVARVAAALVREFESCSAGASSTAGPV